MLANKLKDEDDVTGGGPVDGPGAAAASFALPKAERGGVRGLVAGFDVEALAFSDSGLVGLSGGMGRTVKRGWGETGGFRGGTDVGFAPSPSSSSSWDTGALARGELRDGRVLGRPSPIPKGIDAMGLADAADGTAGLPKYDDGSLTGDPGGVVLSSSLIVGRPEGDDGLGESDGLVEGEM